MLIDIIKEAFPYESSTIIGTTRFYFEVNAEERKSIHGRYFPALKKIQIFNLSRPAGHIITTAVHEVAHHVDYCFRADSKHDKAFYAIMYKLLIAAVGMHIISLEDITSASDSADNTRLTRFFGDINRWRAKDLKYKQDTCTVRVRNSYTIKELLKSRDYKYSATEQLWEKIINISDLDSENQYLSSITSIKNVDILNGGEIDIKAVYYIAVKIKAKEDEYLTRHGYYFNGFNLNNNKWNKKVLASNVEQEMFELCKNRYTDVKVTGK